MELKFWKRKKKSRLPLAVNGSLLDFFFFPPLSLIRRAHPKAAAPPAPALQPSSQYPPVPSTGGEWFSPSLPALIGRSALWAGSPLPFALRGGPAWMLEAGERRGRPGGAGLRGGSSGCGDAASSAGRGASPARRAP